MAVVVVDGGGGGGGEGENGALGPVNSGRRSKRFA